MRKSRALIVVLALFVAMFAAVAEAKKAPKKAAPAEQEFQAVGGPQRVTAKVPFEMKASSSGEQPIPPAHGKKPESSKPELKELKKASGRKFDMRHLPQTKPVPRDRAELPDPTPNPIMLGVTTDGASYKPPSTDMSVPRATTSVAAPPPLLVFEGLNRQNNGAGSPPDTNGDVGPNYYIQSVNSSIGIYNKADGSNVAAMTFDTFMSQGNFGNLCDTNNFGDPVVLYDTFDDRWIITDFAFKTDASGNVLAPAYQCVAASMNGDPVSGGWNFYSTVLTDVLGDYPKFGIWPDGLYMSANAFSFGASSFQGARAWAFNKAQMYAGSPTVQVVAFNIGSGDFTAVPSNARLQTGTPPPGRPNYFVSTWNFLNAISLYAFHVDWNDPTLSTFTGPDTPLAATSWPNSSVANAAQPGTSTLLDVLQIRAMVQAQYTNFAGAESVWIPHTVRRATGGLAAPRWYQADVTGGTVNANLVQATTWDPDGANVINRFMPSLALDRAGNMAMGYSTSNGTVFPSMNYAGRLASDPVNTFSKTEQTLFTGTASQTGTTRWGDYSSMTLDPDGCTFWYTSEYANPVSQAFDQRWKTKVGVFRYAECTPVGAGGTVNGVVTVSGGAPRPGATVMLGSRSTTTDGAGAFAFNVPAGTYPSISASYAGFSTASSSSVSVTDGGTTTVNLVLNASLPNGCAVDTTVFDFQNSIQSNVDTTTTPGAVQLLKPDILQQTSTSLGTSGVGITITTWGGQTFTPSATGIVTRADINLFCSGCTGTTPNLTLSIRATSGGLPTGADLTTATITGFNSGSSGYYTGVFSPAITLTAGTQYAMVIRPTANPSPGTYALTRSGTSTAGADVYAGGSRVSGATSGTVWSIPLTGGVSTDAGFHIYYNNGYISLGTLTGSLRDTNPGAGLTPIWSTLTWNATTPANTAVKFQVAGSSSSSGPFNFVGPDGTNATYFTTSGASLAQFYGMRYLRYEAFLTTNDGTVTPVLNDVTMCFNNADCSGTPPITPSANPVCANGTGYTASAPAGMTSYSWQITNGSITGGATAQTVTFTAGASGNVSLTVNVVDPAGCQKTNTINIPIDALPQPTINASGSTTICSGLTVTLTSSAPTGNQWYLNGSPINLATAQQYVASASGSYTVQVGDGTCFSPTSAATVVTVNSPPPVPTISADTNSTGTQDQACPEVPLTLHANGATGATSFQWYQNNDLLNGETNSTYQATGAANYYVTATANGCTSAQSAAYLVQNPTPHSPFISFRNQDSSVTTLHICQGSSQIIDSDSATGIRWWVDGVDQGNGSQSYTFVSTTPSTHTFTAQLNALGCHSQFGRTVTIIVDALPPTPTISGDTNATGTQDQACPEQPLTLHANGATGATSYTWYSDNAVIPNENTSTLVMTGVGNISVTATNGTCTTAHSATYVVQNPTPHSPFISFRNQSSTVTTLHICQGSSQIIDSDSATGIRWWVDGVDQGNGNQSYTFVSTTPSTHTFTAQLNALGCHSQFGRTVTIIVDALPATPTINASGSTTFCAGGSVTLTSSSATGNQWYLNGSPINAATSNTYNATATGSYTVVVTTSGCSSATSAATSVTVNPLPATPTITPGGPTTFCAGGSVTLTSSSATGNQWYLNGSPINAATSNTYNATASGNYTVIVTDGNSCSSAASAATTVTVNPIPATPTINAGGPTTFCAGGSVTLTSSSATGNQWYLNGSPINAATSNTYNATANGNYTVVVTTTGCSSAASAATSVTVNPIPATPTISNTTPTTFCAGGSVTLTSSSATGNQWYLNGSAINTATAQTYVASTSGDYTVVVTTSGCSSAASAAKMVTVNPNPNATITAPSAVASLSTGNAASVASAGAGATYNWSITNGTITSGTGTNAIQFTAGTTGTLTLQVTVTTSASCSDTKSANVTVGLPLVGVTSVSPSSGTPAGNTAVTINGSGFQSGATVTFGGSAATNVVVVSGTKITAKTPAHGVGPVTVKVTNPDTSNNSLAAGYTYAPQFDVNNDHAVDPSDIFYLVNYLFLNGPAPSGAAGMLSGDANGDGVVDPADIFYLVKYLYNGGPAPMSVPTHGTTMAAVNAMSGSVKLGQPVLRGEHYVVPVIVSWNGATPQALSLKLAFDRNSGAMIRRAADAAGAQTSFEITRSGEKSLSYLVSYTQPLAGNNGSAVVAEIDIPAHAGALRIDVDRDGTLLSDEGGVRKATVATETLTVSGVAIEAQPREPRAPRSVE